MTNAIKGMLLSGLVLPGLGQIVLRHYFRGITFILSVAAGLAVMIYEGEKIAARALTEIQANGGLIDMQTITEVATRAVAAPESILVRGSLYFIIACWAVSIIDACFIGKKHDRRSENLQAPHS